MIMNLQVTRRDVLWSSIAVGASLLSGCRDLGVPSQGEPDPAVVKTLEVNPNKDVSQADLNQSASRSPKEYVPVLPNHWKTFKSTPQAFGPSGERLIDRLESLFLREFSNPNPTQPEGLVDGLVECLLAHGLSRQDVKNTVQGMIDAGAFTFADQKRASARLVSMFAEGDVSSPDPRDFISEKTSTSSPHGVFFLEWYGARDPFGSDLEYFEDYLKSEGAFVMQSDQTVAPVIRCVLWTGRDAEGPWTASVSCGVEVVSHSDPDKVYFTSTLSGESRVTETPIAADLFTIPITVPVSDLKTGDKLSVRLWYHVVEKRDDATEEPATFRGECHLLLEARQGSGSASGFSIEGSSVGGPLPIPALVNPVFISFLRSDINYAKKLYQEEQIRELRKEELLASLIGADLKQLDMAYVPGQEGPSLLNLPKQGKVRLVIGASWCGPCRALDPLVIDYRDFLERSGLPESLLKVSIENDESLQDRMADPHFKVEFPDGVLSEAQQQSLAVDRVPYYFEIEDGKIYSHGVLNSDVLTSWKAGSEALLDR